MLALTISRCYAGNVFYSALAANSHQGGYTAPQPQYQPQPHYQPQPQPLYGAPAPAPAPVHAPQQKVRILKISPHHTIAQPQESNFVKLIYKPIHGNEPDNSIGYNAPIPPSFVPTIKINKIPDDQINKEWPAKPPPIIVTEPQVEPEYINIGAVNQGHENHHHHHHGGHQQGYSYNSPVESHPQTNLDVQKIKIDAPNALDHQVHTVGSFDEPQQQQQHHGGGEGYQYHHPQEQQHLQQLTDQISHVSDSRGTIYTAPAAPTNRDPAVLTLFLDPTGGQRPNILPGSA